MWYWRPPQINTHQDSHELVAPVAIENESMALMQCPSVLSAPTSNGPFLYSKCYIAAATHD